MAKKLKKIGHPLRKKIRRRKIKVAADNNPVEKIVVSAERDATETQAVECKTTTEDAKFHTAKEAADMLGVTAKQVTAFLQNNRLPNAEKVSGRWRIPETDIQALKEEI